ncbi:hypothetical protein C2S52_000937 [Perilla frutescens var. hirtella]|nr:hypothetical protein C2S51_007605 [Perilla frutescens var. frutescens]KAH6800473.1 hypothetical protein C2S52_000937 [Perilla frutescens var. hirtella]
MGSGLPLLLLVALATLVSSCDAKLDVDNPIRLVGVGSDSSKINCQSFRVGVEANNLREWPTIPSYCKSYIKSYLTSKQYGLDIEAVVGAVTNYAVSFNKDYFLTDVFVFDVEETLLSNLKFLSSSEVNYGTIPFTMESYYAALLNSSATALEPILELYNILIDEEGFQIILISEAPESLRQNLTTILETAGYKGWRQLILKGDADNGKSVMQYKSDKRTELVSRRYRIAGNIGDQWSDLTGENPGIRTFKVPNPVYYVY